MDELEIMDPQGEKVKIGGQEFLVKPLVFRQYRKMAVHVAEIFEKIGIDDLSADADLTDLAGKLVIAGGPVIRILAEVLGTEETFLENNLTLEGLSSVVLAVLRQNKLPEVMGNFQKIVPLLGTR